MAVAALALWVYDRIMSTEANHVDAQRRHEALYRRTVALTIKGIETGQYSEGSESRLLENLRRELAQCVEMLLISPEFYVEQMRIVSQEVSHVMDAA